MRFNILCAFSCMQVVCGKAREELLREEEDLQHWNDVLLLQTELHVNGDHADVQRQKPNVTQSQHLSRKHQVGTAAPTFVALPCHGENCYHSAKVSPRVRGLLTQIENLRSGRFESNKNWFIGMGSAIIGALAMSSDDFIWLAPFTWGPQQEFYSAVYILCMELVVVSAWVLVNTTYFMDKHTGPWLDLEQVLEITSTVLLGFYSVYLFFEWLHDDGEDDEDTMTEESLNEGRICAAEQLMKQGDDKSNNAASPDNTESAESTAKMSPRTRHCDERSFKHFFILCMIGSLDNLALYISLLLAEVCDGMQLVIGVFLNSLLVVGICHGLGGMRSFVYMIEMVPVWVIMGGLTIWAACCLIIFE